jgi:hypothetical protein
MKKPLELVTSNSPSPSSDFHAPPPNLGKPGADFWRKVVREYHFDDTGSLMLLELACQALDRAESLRQRIDQDGEMIPSPNGLRAHPLLKEELNNRTFLARTLARLGLDREPIQMLGRPPRGVA